MSDPVPGIQHEINIKANSVQFQAKIASITGAGLVGVPQVMTLEGADARLIVPALLLPGADKRVPVLVILTVVQVGGMQPSVLEGAN